MTGRIVANALGAFGVVLVLAALPGCFHCWADPPCGDGLCEPAESCTTCPFDCVCEPCTCGNTLCEPGCFEDCETCPQDCAFCPMECVCGDGWCDFACGEDGTWCPEDCEGPECVCGNGLCEPDCMESCQTCPLDCGCGDGWCEPECEDSFTCPNDCGMIVCLCGDAICDSPTCGEGCFDCPFDCGACPEAGLHDWFPPGAAMGAETLAGAVVDFTPSAGAFTYAVSCAAALPDAPGTGSTSYSPAITGCDGTGTIGLPFGFPFYGVTYVSTWVAANGFLSLTSLDGTAPLTDAAFYDQSRLAPLATDLAGGSVVVDEYITRVTVTWQGWIDATTGAPVADFQATLWSVGDVRFAWAAGWLGYGVYVGLSEGGAGVGTAVDLVPPGGCP